MGSTDQRMFIFLNGSPPELNSARKLLKAALNINIWLNFPSPFLK